MKTRIPDRIARWAATASFALLLSTATHAAINISTQATQNMSCSAGVCTATAKKAVLNVNDLTTMLAAGDATVKSGSIAQDIDIKAAISWTSTSRLTLDAQRSVEFEQPVAVAGTGALTLTTNDGGTGGDYWFDKGANVTFLDTSSSLIINGQSFTLVKSVSSLVSDVAHNSSGLFALTNNMDGTGFGIIVDRFSGTLEGLGNAINGLRAKTSSYVFTGFFGVLSQNGVVRDLNLVSVHFAGKRSLVGIVAGWNSGTIAHVATSGSVYCNSCDSEGGLAGRNDGQIERSSSSAKVKARYGFVGGLVGWNGDTGAGTIRQSYFIGSITGFRGDIGGIAGLNSDTTIISDCYSTGTVSSYLDGEEFGGLLGRNGDNTLAHSYSTAHVSGAQPGGVSGYQYPGAYHYRGDYWDLDTSGISDPAQGVGNIPNAPGVTGLTDAQLKSALPDGFDRKIWGQDAHINHGYPYLLANPPPSNAPVKRAAKTPPRGR